MAQRKESEKQIAKLHDTALKFDGMVEEKISKLMNERNALQDELKDLKEKLAEIERQNIDYKIQISRKDALITGLQQQLNQAQLVVHDSKKYAEIGYGMAYKWTDEFNRPISRGSPSTSTPVPSSHPSNTSVLVSTVTDNESQKNGFGMKMDPSPKQMMDVGNVGNEVMVVEILEEEEENNVNPNNSSDSMPPMAPMDPLV